MPFFSIIIPVYNAEKTLRRCLNSVILQSFMDYEAILIDDGSSDNSYKICKEYKDRDQRFVTIHQPNAGPSAARNAGLDIAKGNWVCFVDSDDYVEPFYLQDIFDNVQTSKSDMVFFGYNKISGLENRMSVTPDAVYLSKIDYAKKLSENDLFGYTWIKGIKRETIGDGRFDPSIDLFEDEIFACQMLKKCGSISVIGKPLYNYTVDGENSLIGKTHEDYCLLCNKVYNAWKEIKEPSPEFQEFLDNKANQYVSRCYYYAFEHKVNIKNFFNDLNNCNFFQEHSYFYRLDKAVKNKQYYSLYLAKIRYRSKVFVSSIVKDSHKKNKGQ